MNYNNQNNSSIILKTETSFIQIFINNITHIVCDEYTTIINTTNGDKYISSKKIKEFETELSNFGFILINRSTIINARYMLQIIRNKNKTIIFIDKKTKFSIARNRWSIIKSKLEL